MSEDGISFYYTETKEEILRCSREGFFVRGVKVEQENEAAVVYKTFLEWLEKSKEWSGLSDDEINKVARKSQEGLSPHDDTYTFARAVEAALKAKNHG